MLPCYLDGARSRDANVLRAVSVAGNCPLVEKWGNAQSRAVARLGRRRLCRSRAGVAPPRVDRPLIVHIARRIGPQTSLQKRPLLFWIVIVTGLWIAWTPMPFRSNWHRPPTAHRRTGLIMTGAAGFGASIATVDEPGSVVGATGRPARRAASAAQVRVREYG